MVFSFFFLFTANRVGVLACVFCFFLACSLRLVLHSQITPLYLQCLYLSRSLWPQSSSLLEEASARTLLVLDVDGWMISLM